MKKAVKTAWLVIAFASVLVGIWILITEGVRHSGFWIYFVTAVIAFLLNFGSDIFKRPEKDKRKK